MHSLFQHSHCHFKCMQSFGYGDQNVTRLTIL
jgi:hypothetical protein